VVLLSVIVAVGGVLTTIDPITITEYSVVFSAVALPLTYFPILVISNDRDYMGDKVNGRISNTLATLFFLVIVVAATAAIPLMLLTKAGQ